LKIADSTAIVSFAPSKRQCCASDHCALTGDRVDLQLSAARQQMTPDAFAGSVSRTLADFARCSR